MKALRITAKGKTRVIALAHPGVLNAILNCADVPDSPGGEDINLHLGGLDCTDNCHVRWDRVDLEVGDEVLIEVIEDCEGDKPNGIIQRHAALELEREKEHLRLTARKLGRTIDEGT